MTNQKRPCLINQRREKKDFFQSQIPSETYKSGKKEGLVHTKITGFRTLTPDVAFYIYKVKNQ